MKRVEQGSLFHDNLQHNSSELTHAVVISDCGSVEDLTLVPSYEAGLTYLRTLASEDSRWEYNLRTFEEVEPEEATIAQLQLQYPQAGEDVPLITIAPLKRAAITRQKEALLLQMPKVMLVDFGAQEKNAK